jgi:hypothetical protein
MIRVVHPGSRIPDPDADFLPSRIPDPGGQKGTQSRIPDPDPQHWLRIRDNCPSRIPDLGSRLQKQQQKRGVKKNCCYTFLCSHKFHKTKNYFSFKVQKKKLFGKFSKNFYPKNCHYALKNMGLGSGIRDPGYGKNLFRIRIPGSKRHRIPDPDPQNCGSEIKMSTHLYSGFSRVLYWRATTEPPSAIPASSLSTTVPLLLTGGSSCSSCSSLSPQSTGSRTPLIKSAVSEVSSRTPSRSAGKSAAARVAAPSRGCPAAAAAMSVAESVRRHLRGRVASVIVASADRRFSCLKKKKFFVNFFGGLQCVGHFFAYRTSPILSGFEPREMP